MKWETKNRINNLNQLNQARQNNKNRSNLIKEPKEERMEERSIYDGCGVMYTELLIEHLKEMQNECDNYINESEGK